MISSLLQTHKQAAPVADGVFWVILDPTSQMNKTAKHENIAIRGWLHNSTRLTWNLQRFFHKSKSKWNEPNSSQMHKVPLACSII